MKLLGIGDNVLDDYRWRQELYPGGNSVNVPVLARRYDGSTAAYIGVLADDGAGLHFASALREEGVDISRVRVMHGISARNYIELDEAGDRHFVGNNGRETAQYQALLCLTPGDYAMMEQYDLAHTSIHSWLDAYHPAISRRVPLSLAFPAYTVNSLFGYLYNSQAPRKELFAGSHSPIVRLSTIDTLMIQNRLSFLNQLSSSDMEEKNTHLRAILIDIMYSYIIPELEKQKRSSDASNLPAWLVPALEGLSNPKNLTMGMDYLVRQTQRSPEHICRMFRKHLGITPSAYINGKRLN